MTPCTLWNSEAELILEDLLVIDVVLPFIHARKGLELRVLKIGDSEGGCAKQREGEDFVHGFNVGERWLWLYCEIRGLNAIVLTVDIGTDWPHLYTDVALTEKYSSPLPNMNGGGCGS